MTIIVLLRLMLARLELVEIRNRQALWVVSLLLLLHHSPGCLM